MMIDARKSRYIAAAIVAAALLISAGMVTISCAGVKGAVRDAAPEEESATLADYDIRLINAGACRLHLANGDVIDAYQELAPKKAAYYEGCIEVDLSRIRPMIAMPFHPSNVYSIEEVQRYGVNVKPCDKTTKVREQLASLSAWTIYVTRRSVHLHDEGRKYLYKQRPDGTWTNEPIDFFNHGIDALRYAVYTGVVLEGAGGSYFISFGQTRHRR